MKAVLGLIGGIGSGKSLVADQLSQLGGRVISGDRAGHEALRQPNIREQVIQRWGPRILDDHGAIDRRKVGAIVFADLKERRALEAIVHPWIQERLRGEISAAQADPAAKFLVVDAAVMLEASWAQLCDRLIYVDAPDDVRRQRLTRQRGWSEKEVEARERAQLPLADKVRRADATVDNSGSPEHLAAQLGDLLTRWGILTNA
ncbi:MAG: dephospho-CoA kinase [Acidobacteria bacterium]|nr:MAG: dephospho-CoA kinase [Acidobacteriota bacterium]